MSDEQLRDLADRVVAMAPEPPPFPEEVTVAPSELSRRWTPAVIVLVAAAIVVTVVAVPLILLAGTGEPVSLPTTGPTFPTTLPPTTLPAPTTYGSTSTMPESSGTIEREAVVYLTQIPENSVLGFPTLVPFVTRVVTTAPELDEDATALVAAALQLLTRNDLVLPDGMQSRIPEGVEVQRVTSDGDGLVVDMNGRFVEGTGGLLGDVALLNQLVYTATAYGADTVRFTVDGEPIDSYGALQLEVLTEAIGRDDLLDELSPIVITEPLVSGGDELPRIQGIANVFEATVSLEIIDGGQVAYRDSTTATCGTGCWGEFSFTLDTPSLTSDAVVRVFWSSPQDGSPSDVVTIPVGDVWNLAPEE
jgi:Immunoglobulin-like domain of bacterial spore germination/Sporulation and spore germination